MTYPGRTNVGRRAFLQDGTLLLAAMGCDLSSAGPLLAKDNADRPALSFGLVTDLHHADKPAAGSRHYRETLGKLAEAAKAFQTAKPDFVVELGDLIDAADSVETELAYLKTITKAFAQTCPDRHFVLGNHCVDTLTKDEFLAGVGQQKSYFSFDRGGIHFVILDSCFRADGTAYGRKNFQWTDANIPQHELDWLKEDLNKTSNKVIVFAHQRLDVTKDHSVKNAAAVRKILEESGKVLAVFQGHSHHNDYQEIGGIHYCTLVAMIEGSGATNNGFSTANVAANGTITLSGFRKQKGYRWIVKG